MIDKSTGIVDLDRFKVGQHSKLVEMSEAISQRTLQKQKTGEDWTRVFGNEGDKFAYSLYFIGNCLEQIHFGFNIDNEPKGWDDWCEEHELKRKSFHDDFLFTELGNAPYEYEWGTVSTYFDQKGGSSSIGIAYFPK